MSPYLILSVAIFAATLFLVIRRPYRIGIGYSALAGAAVTIVLGLTTLGDIEIVWNIVWNATFTLVAIIIISLLFDEAGFFEYLASRIVRFSRGKSTRLFVFIILLGALTSAFFANDGTVLVLTPIVYSILVRMGASRDRILPFIMATGFIADTASLPLVVSNLVNIVSASYFHIPFLRYSAVMIIPDLAAISASILFLWIYFRKSIVFSYPERETVRIEDTSDPLLVRIALPFMAAIIVLYAVGGLAGIPVAFIAVPAAVVLVGIAASNRKVGIASVFRSAPWQIVLFSLGMYIVVFAMGRHGVTSALTFAIVHVNTLPAPLSVVLSGFLFAAIAATMNNMPSVMMVNLSLSQFGSGSILVYANALANDIGPKFTIIGSLATLLWLHSLERKGVGRISAWYYTKLGLFAGIPVLTVTLLALWAVYPIMS